MSFDLFEYAIASVADAKAILERLYMDVGRPRLGSARDQAVDQSDDRRLARHVTQSLRLVRIHAERLWGRRPAGRELGGIDPVEPARIPAGASDTEALRPGASSTARGICSSSGSANAISTVSPSAVSGTAMA